jgi:hypothetical protein
LIDHLMNQCNCRVVVQRQRHRKPELKSCGTRPKRSVGTGRSRTSSVIYEVTQISDRGILEADRATAQPLNLVGSSLKRPSVLNRDGEAVRFDIRLNARHALREGYACDPYRQRGGDCQTLTHKQFVHQGLHQTGEPL